VTSFKFSKKEKLKSRKVIQQLFQKRQSIHVFPLRVIYGKIDSPLSKAPVQFGVSVSKRSFAKAVKRNRIKRIIREAYRLNKGDLYNALAKSETKQFAMMFLYTGKKEPSIGEIEKSLKKIFKIFLKNAIKIKGSS
jgi:ribonuclease P protein component